jgi:hypothetical protein
MSEIENHSNAATVASLSRPRMSLTTTIESHILDYPAEKRQASPGKSCRYPIILRLTLLVKRGWEAVDYVLSQFQSRTILVQYQV